MTARVEYALQAMVALAGSDAAPFPANAFAEKLDLSYNYLLTIVAELRRAGFVNETHASQVDHGSSGSLTRNGDVGASQSN